MNRQFTGNDSRVRLFAPLPRERKTKTERQQSEKPQSRFEQQQNRKVEPHTVRISVTQDIRRPASGDQNQQQASQIQPGRHKYSSEWLCRCPVAKTVKRIR